MSLDEIADGREVITAAGTFFLIDRIAHQFIRSFGESMSRCACSLKQQAVLDAGNSFSTDLVKFAQCDPGKKVFLDIETTGLCGRPLFLIGLLLYRDGKLLVRQLFARDYSEEKPLLQYLTALLDQFEVVVTFNGKSFDIPYIRDRCSYHMIPFEPELHHLDLLPEYRRRWKNILPDCRLQTLESRICYRNRDGDISGSEIPNAYHDFVRTGNARVIKDILHHNAFDLITMADLTSRLLNPESEASEDQDNSSSCKGRREP